MSAVLFVGLYLYRLIGACLIRTYFDPDEYWQCIEPAARLAFGEGALTWEWRAGIRSWNYPVLFALAFWTADRWLKMDRALIVDVVPKAIQALVTCTIDYYTYKLARKWCPRVARRALLVSLSSWFLFAYVNRTLSNSLEAALTAMALYHEGTLRGVLIALSSIVRPTAVLNWVFVLLPTYDLVVLMATVHFWNSLFDALFYGHLTFVPWRFLSFNVARGVAGHFGVSSCLYYFASALPAMLLSFSFSFVKGLRSSPRFLLLHLCGPLLVYSLLSHKEIRFLMPLLPSLHIISALGMRGMNRQWFKVALLLQAVSAVYFATLHQSAPVGIVRLLRSAPAWNKQVMFLMPCHSVPWTGFLAIRSKVEWRQLECDPLRLDAEGMDESDHFYLDPQKYIDSHEGCLLDTVVTFQPLSSLMERNGFVEVKRLSNGPWNPDERRSGDMIIWRRVD